MYPHLKFQVIILSHYIKKHIADIGIDIHIGNRIASGFQMSLHVSTTMLYLIRMWEIHTSVRKYSTVKRMRWRNSIFTLRIKGQDHYLSPCTDFSSKYLKDFNEISAILKHLKDKVQNMHHLNSIGSQTIN